MRYEFVTCGLLFLGHLVVAAFNKRDTDPSLETLIIPLALDNTPRYSVAVGMSPGPDQQSFSFILSTGTGYSVVAGVDCDNCDGVSSYNVNQSTTAKQLPDVQSVSLLGTNASGSLIEENCQLTQSNGSPGRIPIKHVGKLFQPIIVSHSNIPGLVIVANTSLNLFSPGISGVFGLGTNGRNELHIWNDAKSPWDSGTNGGVLHWQSPDTALFEDDVVWKTMSAFNSTSLQSDWFISMDSLSFTNGGAVTVSQSGDLITAVDPFESAIIFPQAIAGAIYGGIAGSSLLPSSTTASNQWAIPCDTKMSLTMTFGSLSVPMDETTLVLQSGNVCVGTIEEWSDPEVEEYLLGSTFISLLYLIFSISGSSQGSVGFAHRKSPAKLSAGQVSGIVLGSVTFSVLLVLGFFWYRHRQKERQKRELPSPFISPPMSPNHQGSLDVNQDATAASTSFALSPSFNRNDLALMSPHSDSREIMAALPSSVYTMLRPNHTPAESSFGDIPPPYSHSVTNAISRQALRAQKSQATFQTDITPA
ncbi:aspartic peptidase domain-containing protein [Lentinula guzmanii]|uniref:Aspartic peptidase domain-containing protein n=1 Tax=Lentinula guzmanii TaxID=2804957 RepID=A0AA38J759_9AGAR|nr:aspartic peptidase domain-containing protein [Lentinula guzmanii]